MASLTIRIPSMSNEREQASIATLGRKRREEEEGGRGRGGGEGEGEGERGRGGEGGGGGGGGEQGWSNRMNKRGMGRKGGRGGGRTRMGERKSVTLEKHTCGHMVYIHTHLLHLFSMLNECHRPLFRQLCVSCLGSLTQEGQRGGDVHKGIRDMVHHCTPEL